MWAGYFSLKSRLDIAEHILYFNQKGANYETSNYCVVSVFVGYADGLDGVNLRLSYGTWYRLRPQRLVEQVRGKG